MTDPEDSSLATGVKAPKEAVEVWVQCDDEKYAAEAPNRVLENTRLLPELIGMVSGYLLPPGFYISGTRCILDHSTTIELSHLPLTDTVIIESIDVPLFWPHLTEVPHKFFYERNGFLRHACPTMCFLVFRELCEGSSSCTLECNRCGMQGKGPDTGRIAIADKQFTLRMDREKNC